MSMGKMAAMTGASETSEAHAPPVAPFASLANTVDKWPLSVPGHWTASALQKGWCPLCKCGEGLRSMSQIITHCLHDWEILSHSSQPLLL